MYAFRCKPCGHLHAAEVAGVCDVPRACNVCRRRDFEVLADATPERLEEIGLTAEQVVKHAPDKEADRLHNLDRCKQALAHLEAKKARWSKDKKNIVKEAWALEDQLAELDKKRLDQFGRDDHDGLADTVNKVSDVKAKIADLVSSEWTARDEAHVAELQKAIAAEGNPPSKGGANVRRGASESAFNRDKA